MNKYLKIIKNIGDTILSMILFPFMFLIEIVIILPIQMIYAIWQISKTFANKTITKPGMLKSLLMGFTFSFSASIAFGIPLIIFGII